MTFDPVDSSTRPAPRAPLQALPYDSLANVAQMGKFSSDRKIRQYADEIWGITPMQVS